MELWTAMITITKVLFATDFSNCAKTAQEYAAAFAEQFHAELHLLHVATITHDPGTALSLPQNYLIDIETEARLSLDKLFPDAANEGRSIVRSVRTGNPSVEIVKYAEETGADLIVVGTHGHGALLHMLIGSVAEKVVRKAICPVLSVRPSRQPA